ncbi:winged helix-turn-helix domain-containing protein [Vibrio ouci]|uniref:Transcriptional regulator n=1 Tax=Vibrio ouci TaxID=2499078 RepID=A0A4Y8WAK6_9VIBR|nr:winged helix-turn-helix domain-containing protein [Vibrio ouci]TFH89952.1 transcriptional regulator [Vibrio ouci]
MLLINDTHVLDETGGFIHSLKSNIRHPVGVNELSLLSYMFTNQGQVLSKHELMNEVWHKRGIVVESSSLLHSISTCRRGLEDKAGEVIRTERGVGYEFTGSVRKITSISEVIGPKEPIVETPSVRELEHKAEVRTKWNAGHVQVMKLFSILVLAILVGFVGAKYFYNSPLFIGYKVTSYKQCSYMPNQQGEKVYYQNPTLYLFEKLSLLVDSDGRSVSFNTGSEAVNCE